MIYHLPLVEKLFVGWRPWLSRDLDAYRNHVYRVINLACAFSPDMDREDFLMLQVAAAFHDVGIWRGDHLDYLQPSADQACAFLARNVELGDRSLELKQRLVRTIVYQHHRIRPITGPGATLAEAFRKAHWMDLAAGWLPFSLPRDTYRQIKKTFPDAGFHRRLLQIMGMRLLHRPLSPLPQLKP